MTMEDAHIIELAVGGVEEISLFAVFDGHRGDDVAKFAAETFIPQMTTTAEYKTGKKEDHGFYVH